MKCEEELGSKTTDADNDKIKNVGMNLVCVGMDGNEGDKHPYRKQ